MKTERLFLSILMLVFLSLLMLSVKAENSLKPANVKVGVWLVNVEKVDLAASSYRLDFYLWFSSSEISLENVMEFEFINGFPTKYEIYANEKQGHLNIALEEDFIQTINNAIRLKFKAKCLIFSQKEKQAA